jgi:hypothetical protein
MKRFAVCATLILLVANYVNAEGTWTAVNKPGTPNGTAIAGISGNSVLGMVNGSNYIYDKTNGSWSVLPYKMAVATGISGSNVVGMGNGQSYVYNISSQKWTTLAYPGGSDTHAYGISGNSVVGWYYGDNTTHGFLYDGVNYSSINYPGATHTNLYAIDGNRFIGGCNYGGFLYDGTNWTILSYPGSTYTNPYGISGDNIVGVYGDSSGNRRSFLYDGTNWTTLDMPGTVHQTYVTGIDGSNVVGSYYDGAYNHGFIYTIPEPATIGLLALGGLLLRKRRV